MRVAVVASAQIFGGFQNLPPPQSLDFSAFFGLSHLFPPRLSISVIFDTDLVTSQKATELKDLDLAYAPPYSSAKDPVNMAGFMVENIANGVLKQWHLEDADRLPRDGSVTLLDTRTVEEFAHGHIDGFFNIPVDELRERLGELDKRKPVYVICQSGLRSYIACRILAGNGFDCYNFSGGFRFYDAVTNDRCLIESATACGMDRA